MTAMHEDLVDAVRSPVIFIYMFIVLPITLAVAPLGDTVELDFQAYRLQQFDLQGSQYGTSVLRFTVIDGNVQGAEDGE
jgi:hypothetical protein